MNLTENELIEYQTTGTCCKLMKIEIKDSKIVDAQFTGGCAGNLVALARIIKGKRIEEVIALFKGLKCGKKETSCPDQLAICLEKHLYN